jgi:hypothetical protein
MHRIAGECTESGRNVTGLDQGTIDENGILTIDLDFVIPSYRNFKISKYLFNDKGDYSYELPLNPTAS